MPYEDSPKSAEGREDIYDALDKATSFYESYLSNEVSAQLALKLFQFSNEIENIFIQSNVVTINFYSKTTAFIAILFAFHRHASPKCLLSLSVPLSFSDILTSQPAILTMSGQDTRSCP